MFVNGASVARIARGDATGGCGHYLGMWQTHKSLPEALTCLLTWRPLWRDPFICKIDDSGHLVSILWIVRMRLNRFDLNQIVCLDALLTECNVSRAAERVHLSQSAMSAVLARLRSHFDDPLLVRSGRTLVPTPFARSLVGPVGELLSRAHALTALVPDQAPGEIDRELRVVASDYIMEAFLAASIQRACASMPNLRFDVLPLTSQSAQSLNAGEIDLLFAGQAFDAGRPPNEKLFEDKFVCLASPEYAPPDGVLTPSEYIARRHVVVRYFEYQMTFGDEEALRHAGLNRMRQVAVWSHSLVPQLICGTPMIGTAASRAVVQIADRWRITIFPFPLEQESMRVYAYWHSSRDEDSVIRDFMEIAREAVAETAMASTE